MPWKGTLFAYNERTILASGPRAAGVYALWRSSQWIYIGESTNVLARLLEHVRGENECINQQGPTGFGFELIENVEQRTARQRALVIELAPICNPLPA